MNDVTDRFLKFYRLLLTQQIVKSANDFADKIGVSTSLITEFLKKRSNVGVTPIQSTVREFFLNSDWLLTGEPEDYLEQYLNVYLNGPDAHLNAHPNAHPNGNISDNKALKRQKEELKTVTIPGDQVGPSSGVPYYDLLPVSAGDFTSFLSQAKPTSYINLPQLTDCTAVLPVYGSSMKGVVEPGDLIAIKEVKTRDEFDPALPYMIITDEHRMIKYLHVDENDGNIIWAESTNHAKIKLSVESIKMVYAIKCVVRFF